MFVWPPRPLQPLVDRDDRKLAHSLRFVLPRMTAPAARRRPTTNASRGRLRAEQGQRAGRRLHVVGGVDVVLDQDRDAVERPARAFLRALPVELAGDGQGVGIHLDDGVETRSAPVDLLDPLEVERDEALGGRRSRRHHLLEPGDRRLLEREGNRGGLFRGLIAAGHTSRAHDEDRTRQEDEPGPA